jgi:hypothetical protein
MRGCGSAGERAGVGGVAAVVAVWLLTSLLWLTPGLNRPDGVGYFIYLTSTWFDGDLLFFDEWAQAGLIRDGQILFKDVTQTGHLSNHWTAGASLAWYPAFIAANALVRVGGGATYDGFAAPYVAAIAFTSALAGLFALLCGYRVARLYFGDGVAAASAIAIWFGSPLAWYSLRHASMSHAISAAACIGVVLLSLRLRNGVAGSRLSVVRGFSPEVPDNRQPTTDNNLTFAVGLAIGFACAVRPQNVAIALVPLFVVELRPLLRRAHALFLGALIAALPQLIVSTVLWGGPLVFVNIGGRAHSWQMFAKFRPLETLFSWYHGLVPWTPLVAIAIVGLFLLHRHDRGLARAGLATFAAQLLLLSWLERWFWGGASFGQRRFDSCTIFFILGIGAVLHRLPKWLGALIAIAAAAWTMLLFIAATRLNLNRFQTPAELLAAFQHSLGDPAWRSFLGFTPPGMRGTVIIAAIVTTLVAALLFVIGRKAGTIAATVYLIAMSLFYGWCGLHPHYDALAQTLIVRNARGELASGSKGDTIGLLQDEADYMQRTGRHAEAAAALAEAAAMRR